MTFPTPIWDRNGKYFDLYAAILIGLEGKIDGRKSELGNGRVVDGRDAEIAWSSYLHIEM